MEKTITITEGEYRKLVAETTAEIMTEKFRMRQGSYF